MLFRMKKKIFKNLEKKSTKKDSIDTTSRHMRSTHTQKWCNPIRNKGDTIPNDSCQSDWHARSNILKVNKNRFEIVIQNTFFNRRCWQTIPFFIYFLLFASAESFFFFFFLANKLIRVLENKKDYCSCISCIVIEMKEAAKKTRTAAALKSKRRRVWWYFIFLICIDCYWRY